MRTFCSFALPNNVTNKAKHKSPVTKNVSFFATFFPRRFFAFDLSKVLHVIDCVVTLVWHCSKVGRVHLGVVAWFAVFLGTYCMHFIFQTVKFNVYFRKQLMKNHSFAFSPECSNNGKFFRKTLKEPVACCLIITEKVSFNIASEESNVYILNGKKLVKNAKYGLRYVFVKFWWVFGNLKLAVNQCY